MPKTNLTKFSKYAPQMVADLMNDFGLKDFQAAAFPGQTAAESAWMTDIIEDGAKAKGWAGGTGWFQWTGMKARRGIFERWLRRKGWSADSYEGNYSMVYRELKGSHKSVITAVRKAESLEEATRIVCLKYEGPKDPEQSMSLRIKGAKLALELYRAKPPKPFVWPEVPKEENVPDTELEPVQIPGTKKVVLPAPQVTQNPLTSKTTIGILVSVISFLASIFPNQIPSWVAPLAENYITVGIALISAAIALWGRFTAEGPLRFVMGGGMRDVSAMREQLSQLQEMNNKLMEELRARKKK